MYSTYKGDMTMAQHIKLAPAQVYALTGCGKMRSRTMCLNGRELTLGADDALPALTGEAVAASTLTVAPGGCTFVVV